MGAQGRRRSEGFTLIEVMIALAVTLAIMATLYLVARSSALLHDTETRRTERGMSGLRALDDIALEIARAGMGLGNDVDAIVPGRPGRGPSVDAVTLRSNPDGIVGTLHASLFERDQMVAVDGASLFREGDQVLIADRRGNRERAQVVRAEPGALSFRSLDGPGGRLARRFPSSPGARVIKVREASFSLTTDPLGAVVLAKEATGQPALVLVRHVQALRFDYRDEQGEPLAPGRVRPGRTPAAVGISLRLDAEPGGPVVVVPPLGLVVPLEPQSATVTFDIPRPGFRVRRLFSPMKGAVAALSRPFAEAGVIVAELPAGGNMLATFVLERAFRDVRVDTLVPLGPVRQAVVAAFGPESGPWAGFLFVVTGGLRSIQVWRISPDGSGTIGPASAVDLVMETPDLASLGGAAFGIDGALYLSDPSAGAIFRWVPSDPGQGVARVQPVASVAGRPGPLALGENGSLYCLAVPPDAGGGGAALWELPFDDRGAPAPPRRVARLEGEPRSLATDPLTGSLYVLLGAPPGDTVLLELSRAWLRAPQAPAREALRLSSWKRDLERTLPEAGDVSIPANLFPPSLDFASFDASGALYLGSGKVSLVVKADLDRPGGAGLNRVGVAAIVGQDPRTGRKSVRMNAWRRNAFGL